MYVTLVRRKCDVDASYVLFLKSFRLILDEISRFTQDIQNLFISTEHFLPLKTENATAQNNEGLIDEINKQINKNENFCFILNYIENFRYSNDHLDKMFINSIVSSWDYEKYSEVSSYYPLWYFQEKSLPKIPKKEYVKNLAELYDKNLLIPLKTAYLINKTNGYYKHYLPNSPHLHIKTFMYGDYGAALGKELDLFNFYNKPENTGGDNIDYKSFESLIYINGSRRHLMKFPNTKFPDDRKEDKEYILNICADVLNCWNINQLSALLKEERQRPVIIQSDGMPPSSIFQKENMIWNGCQIQLSDDIVPFPDVIKVSFEQDPSKEVLTIFNTFKSAPYLVIAEQKHNHANPVANGFYINQKLTEDNIFGFEKKEPVRIFRNNAYYDYLEAAVFET